jgi:hypothetical protein
MKLFLVDTMVFVGFIWKSKSGWFLFVMSLGLLHYSLSTMMNAQDRRIDEQDCSVADQAALLQEQECRITEQKYTITALKLDVLSLSGQGGNGLVRLSRWNFPEVKA